MNKHALVAFHSFILSLFLCGIDHFHVESLLVE
jgi:hypothetical protein